LLVRDWSKRVTWENIPQLKLGSIWQYSPIFKTTCVAKKGLKDNKHNSLNLGQKYARIFVLGHYLFIIAHSFPWATLSENCSLLGTDNVCGQISWHIFAPNEGNCLHNTSVTEAIKGLSYSVLCIHKVLVQKVKHLAVCWHVLTKSG